MDITSYDSVVADGVTTDNFTCTVRSWPKALDCTKRDLRTNFTAGFGFKIVFVGRHKDVTEVYFISKQSAAPLRSKVNVCNLRETISLGTQMIQTINKYKWYHIGTFLRRDIKENSSVNESLRLEISFTIYSLPEEDIHGWGQLKTDFQELLNNGDGSDLVIKSTDDVEFKVHKLILTNRSAVIKAHFDHNTIECKTNKMNCPYKSEIVKKLLQYIYTGVVDNLDDTACKLLEAAEFYKLETLKQMCEEALKNQLTVDNAIETLQIASLHGADSLKKGVLTFIKEGEAHHVAKTQGWKSLEQLNLAKEIYEHIVSEEYM